MKKTTFLEGLSLRKAFRFLFSFLIFLSSIGVYFTNRLMYMKKKEDTFIFEREKKQGD